VDVSIRDRFGDVGQAGSVHRGNGVRSEPAGLIIGGVDDAFAGVIRAFMNCGSAGASAENSQKHHDRKKRLGHENPLQVKCRPPDEISRNAGLIARDGRVDECAPLIDPACHALASWNSLLAQPVDYLKATQAMVAENDQYALIRFRFELLEVCRHGAHRDQFGPSDPRKLKLGGFAHIDQVQGLARIQPSL
jgi:hypothetical protein